MKLKHVALIGSLFPILFSLVLFFGVLISADSDDENSNFSSGITGMNLSAEVLKHQPMVEKYAREYGISEYVNVLISYHSSRKWRYGRRCYAEFGKSGATTQLFRYGKLNQAGV